jgi:hypothetical protein
MTAQRIDPRRLPSEVRRVNRGLMDMFIGADPYGRRHLSPRRSVVLYTADGRFGYALDRIPHASVLRRLYEQARRAVLVERRVIAPRQTRRALAKARARLAVCAHAIGDQPSAPGCGPTVPSSAWTAGGRAVGLLRAGRHVGVLQERAAARAGGGWSTGDPSRHEKMHPPCKACGCTTYAIRR